ncbi:hypothetical protein [Hansschlegelia plantiphila]|uniref:Secreted protein n=1 Tax=Hansschlegelia plantiphila TaxID=374655 RepID=A0A9W6J1V1_9HYPH|nr:hypothetical protein [Hansschlegelia plantiphila]GLK68193.1 hypothetical protein GCM10008179_18310 [Hansschlegelia plantiphila]
MTFRIAAALSVALAAAGAGVAHAESTGAVFTQTEQALRAKLKSAYAGQPARFGFENFRRRSNGAEEAVCGQATIYIGRDKPSLVRFVYRYNSGDAAIETLSSAETATVQKLWNPLCLRGRVIE